MIEFEWDSRKADTNLKKHGVSFLEAQSVFYDDYALQFYDEDHAETEDRFVMLGTSNRSRILVVVHAVRTGSTIRIVSARKATANESRYYKGPTQ